MRFSLQWDSCSWNDLSESRGEAIFQRLPMERFSTGSVRQMLLQNQLQHHRECGTSDQNAKNSLHYRLLKKIFTMQPINDCNCKFLMSCHRHL